MNALFLFDLLAFIFLISSLILLWHERNRFFSIRPIIPAIILISIGRLSDMVTEHPELSSIQAAGLTPAQFVQVCAVVGNVTDAIGAGILIFGFISIIRYQQREMKRISNIEELLPLCSNCKKFRTKDNRWLPIEKYLLEMGAPDMTHGICPDCLEKLYGKQLNQIRSKS